MRRDRNGRASFGKDGARLYSFSKLLEEIPAMFTMNRSSFFATAALIVGCGLVSPHPVAAAEIVKVESSWARSTVAGQKASGAFMQLTASRRALLVGAESPVAGLVEIHSMTMENGVMRMHAVPNIPLPPGQKVELRPGGYHVMLLDLKQTLKAGDEIPLTLKIESEDKSVSLVPIKATVRAPGGLVPDQGTSGHGAGH